jgi:hypothetical protein
VGKLKRFPELILMRLLICTLFIDVTSITPGFAQRDTSYIGNYTQKLSINGFIYYDIMRLTNAITELDYIPNNPSGIGAGFSYKNFLFDINYGHKLSSMTDEKYGKTQSFDFQLHKYSNKYVGDFYIQRYRGFHLEEDSLTIDESLFPDLEIFQMGIVGQYIFNGHKFSYQAAFNQNEKQLKSSGSFLLGGGIYYFNIESDSSFIFNDKKTISSFQWGINGGYAYNWVIKKHWLVSGSFTFGLNLGNQYIKSFFGKGFNLEPSFLPRLSIGYNCEKWSFGMKYVGSILTWVYAKDSKINLQGGQFEMTYIRRIDIKPKLKTKSNKQNIMI